MTTKEIIGRIIEYSVMAIGWIACSVYCIKSGNYEVGLALSVIMIRLNLMENNYDDK